METVLKIENLSVSAGEKEILHGVDLTIGKGEVHVLLGPNGTGKSTLGSAIMGSPEYNVTGGKMLYKGEDLTVQSVSERAKNGIFLSFQDPIEVPGITVSSFLRSALEAKSGKRVRLFDFKKQLEEKMEILGMDKAYANRDLNVGFSGGEKKKTEILQMLMLDPELAILDETDSGLDVDAVRTVSQGIAAYKAQSDGGLLIITHSTKILESLHVDFAHIMIDGNIVKTGGAELIDEVNAHGFSVYEAG